MQVRLPILSSGLRISVHLTRLLLLSVGLATLPGTLAAQAPANDLCENATDYFVGTQVTGNTVTATASNGPCNSSGIGVWYRVDIAGTGTYEFNTCTGSDYDTRLSLYRGSSCDALSCVEISDDDCALQSRVSGMFSAGEVAYVYVGGFSTRTGNFTLSSSSDIVAFSCVDLSVTLNLDNVSDTITASDFTTNAPMGAMDSVGLDTIFATCADLGTQQVTLTRFENGQAVETCTPNLTVAEGLTIADCPAGITVFLNQTT